MVLQPGHMAQSVEHLTEEPEVPGSVSDPAIIHHEIFSSNIFPFSLIQEGQLSATGKRIGS